MVQKINNLLLFLLVTITFFSCIGENGKSIFTPNRIEPPSLEDRVSVLNDENIGRSAWQKPALIAEKLGDLENKVVADIGAGTGYFTFYLAYLKAKIIAIDIDPAMTNYIDDYKLKLPLDIVPNIETRLADPDDSKLEKGEIDKAVIINTISYIDNLQEYLIRLKPSFKKGGQLVIVDYKSANIEIDAPPENQLVPTLLLQEYLSIAGYENIFVDHGSLKYQYIVTADIPQ